MLLAAVAAASDKAPLSDAGHTQLILAALAGIGAVVVLIVWAKLHPFLALMVGAGVMGGVAGVGALDIVHSFQGGFGSTMGNVGLLIALGAMVGKILADSGGSSAIVDTLIDNVGPKLLPWAMALVALLLGLPLFFEVGVVLLVPVVILVALKADVPVMRVGIPALAGLSTLHALVPPHPGPLLAIDAVDANLGLTLGLGIVAAVPTLIICGPLLGRLIEQWVPVHAHVLSGSEGARLAGVRTAEDGSPVMPGQGQTSKWRRPSFGAAVFVILLPVVLMLVRAVFEVVESNDEALTRRIFDFLGEPAIALLLAVFAAMWFLGFGVGMNRSEVEGSLGAGLPMVASILLIVAAGGGFKAMLVDAGVGNVIADWAADKNISVLLLGWLVAVGIRLATGSATVATTTAAGIVSVMAVGEPSFVLALLVLAIGCGSVFFSHVNDAGFWLVKEYFGLTIGQTLKSWSLMETAISVVGFGVVMVMYGIHQLVV